MGLSGSGCQESLMACRVVPKQDDSAEKQRGEKRNAKRYCHEERGRPRMGEELGGEEKPGLCPRTARMPRYDSAGPRQSNPSCLLRRTALVGSILGRILATCSAFMAFRISVASSSSILSRSGATLEGLMVV